MKTKRNIKCKICGDKHSCHGFCKYHAWVYKKGRIDIDGKPLGSWFYDPNYRLKKIKDSLTRTVKESTWYRKWQTDVMEKCGRKCFDCNQKGVKSVIHHETKRFCDILNRAKLLYFSIGEQVEYCKREHTVDIGVYLCLNCHAERHKGEKMYSSLKGKSANGKCKICGKNEYCKGFCCRHYKRFQTKNIDIDGKILIPQKFHDKNGKCIVCGEISVGKAGMRWKFCKLHISRYHNKIIDINGNLLREFRVIGKNKKCKICDEKHYGKGFCLTHYNRYKIGQIDIEGNILRDLGEFCVKGSKVKKDDKNEY